MCTPSAGAPFSHLSLNTGPDQARPITPRGAEHLAPTPSHCVHLLGIGIRASRINERSTPCRRRSLERDPPPPETARAFPGGEE